MTNKQIFVSLAFSLGLIFLPVRPAPAATLNESITRMAESLSAYLQEKGQQQIMLGNFDGPGTATAGRAIRNALKEELVKQGVLIVPLGANWTVRGNFSFEPTGSAAIVLVRAELFDSSGKEVSGFRQKVKVEEVSAIEDISRLLGLTVDLDREQQAVASTQTQTGKRTNEFDKQFISSQAKVTNKLIQSVNKPTFAFRNETKTQIAADDLSPFRVEVLVRTNTSEEMFPLEITSASGYPFAPLKADDTYRIRIYNDSDHAVGVKISIDGINTFVLSEEQAYRDMGVWLFAPKTAGTVSGWYVRPDLVKEFLVTAQGAALGLPDASDIGTMTIQFFHAWRDGEQPPAVEKLLASRGQLRTGVGRDISQVAGFQQSYFGKTLLTAISIRYSNPDDAILE